MAETIQKSLKGRDVIDIACGTGWWDRYLSETAKSILGFDINNDVLEVAKSKEYKCPTKFQIGDATIPRPAATFRRRPSPRFWLSHIPKARLHQWIDTLHTTLTTGSHVLHRRQQEHRRNGRTSRHEARRREHVQILRTLKDGSQHMILKNFCTKSTA